MYVKVSELPEMIISGLKSVGYNKSDIEVKPMEEVSPIGLGGDGYRDFIVMINLATGQVESKRGSWGGANSFAPNNQVDLDCKFYTIPPNVVVIKGSEGGNRPVYAKVHIRPDMLLPCLKEANKLPSRLQWIIDVLCSCNTSGRKEEFNGQDRIPPQRSELDQLQTMGLIKINKAGSVTVTTEGKNARTGALSTPKYVDP